MFSINLFLILNISLLAYSNNKACNSIIGNEEQMNNEKYVTDQGSADKYAHGYEIFLKRTDFRDRVDESTKSYIQKNFSKLFKTTKKFRIL